MLEPIYRNRTYKFSYPITVNGVQVDVSGDAVWFSMDKEKEAAEPKLRLVMDVSSGIPVIELTPTQTKELELAEYYVGINWILDNTDEDYQVLFDRVKVIPAV